MITYQQGLNMASLMKDKDHEIRDAIFKCMQEDHGVVALRFSDEGRTMEVEILNEPYDDNVRVFPG